MNMKSKTEASAQYKGFTLTLARGAESPVILVINKNLTSRPDGVLEVVATPNLAKKSVDRRVREVDASLSMEDSGRILEEGASTDLAAAMMGGPKY